MSSRASLPTDAPGGRAAAGETWSPRWPSRRLIIALQRRLEAGAPLLKRHRRACDFFGLETALVAPGAADRVRTLQWATKRKRYGDTGLSPATTAVRAAVMRATLERVGHRNKKKLRCPAGHPLYGTNLYRWRGGRYCRACMRQHNLESYRRRRAKAAGVNPEDPVALARHRMIEIGVRAERDPRYRAEFEAARAAWEALRNPQRAKAAPAARRVISGVEGWVLEALTSKGAVMLAVDLTTAWVLLQASIGRSLDFKSAGKEIHKAIGVLLRRRPAVIETSRVRVGRWWRVALRLAA